MRASAPAFRPGVKARILVAPYDTAGGMKAGGVVRGWRCPGCGQVEINTYLLCINQGWDPSVPGRGPYDGKCNRLRLLARHAEVQAQIAAAKDGAP